jgi:sugar phosphate isomerase/epimerase
MMTRRTLLKSAAAGLVCGTAWEETRAEVDSQASKVKIQIGSCTLGLAEAKNAGLAGVEVGVGGAAETLAIADPKVRQQYKESMKKTGLVIPSFMMGLLNSYPLASDPRGPAWLEQSIDAAQDLGAKVILVAFFGKGDLRANGRIKKEDVEVVVQRLKAAAPRARDAGVILGIENYLSARQNLDILERIRSDSVRIYYDVRNTTDMGYDVPQEIRLLKDQIAQFHFKDGPNYLGEGQVRYRPIAAAIKDIGYQGWIILETSNPSGHPVADSQRNARFIRKLFGMA